MDEDWQEEAFTSRHSHNRVGRGSRHSKRNAAFDVHKTFGTYKVDASNILKRCNGIPDANDSASAAGRIEIYRLTESGDGLIGAFAIAGVLETIAIFAGSRKTLQRLIKDMDDELNPLEAVESERLDEGDQTSNVDTTPNPQLNSGAEESGQEEDDDSERSEAEVDSPEMADRRRFETFEKNSFRMPKFWMAWRGDMVSSRPEQLERIHGTGYIVFSGNDCRKLNGTISCEDKAWNNVNVTGWKDVARHARDTPVCWPQIDVMDQQQTESS
ncbi:catalase [Xylariaceae sp. FL1019]|nr:catalase [Xylariaceae sp. FL1019]